MVSNGERIIFDSQIVSGKYICDENS